MPDSQVDPTDVLVARLRKSRKYAAFCEDTLTRTAKWALAEHAAARPAEKAAKRKLHQISAAYAGLDARRLIDRVAAWDGMEEKAFCAGIMEEHASTRERLPILEEAYGEMHQKMSGMERVVDLACGLNVFALPWLDPERSLGYVGVECDGVLAEAGNVYLKASGRKGKVLCGDLLGVDSYPKGDIYFLFKALPCLDQQGDGSASGVLKRLSDHLVVVSYPAKSLGGREKGMQAHYEQKLMDLADGLSFGVDPIRFAQETFYFLKR